jgi:hypothetical protein
MKKLFLILILQVFIIVGVYSSTYAEVLDGKKFSRMCQSAIKRFEKQKSLTREEEENTLVCVSYIRGFIDSHILEMGDSPPKGYCPPEDVTYDQYSQVFIKYLEDHPEELHKVASKLLYNSLIKAFPCPKQNK